ncbi:uncharacterized protein LOC116777120 isoform X1 [Danaus plexippus]|uniref:uncharacterized protein LOC116777120 isoform X1 n=1 Tax=Danaus plexippus TaxID=13037 RepID=UPI002AAF6D74|nr:uncharacterized protein LOC116777120 isoform X1 [Danaus plexippus]
MSSDEEIYIAPPPNLFSRPSTSKCMPEVIVIDSDSDPEPEPPKLAKKEEFTSRVLRSSKRPLSIYGGHTKKPIPPLLPISLIKKKPKHPKPQPKTEVETVQPIKEEENSAEDAHINKFLVIKELKLRKGPLKLFVDIDPQLKGKWYLASLDGEAEAAGINVRPDSFLEGTGLLLWSKAEESTLVSAQGKMELTPPEVRCPHGLYICEMVDAVPRVRDKVLVNHIKNIEAIACCKLTLVLFGYKEYFRTACKRYPVVKGFDIETAIGDLIISTNCDAIIIDEPSELVMTVLKFNKGFTSLYKYEPMNAISENAEFFMNEFNRRCVPVDDDGVGLARLWQQMVSVLPLTSLESARAVCAKYKSLRSLYEALFTPKGFKSIASIDAPRTILSGRRVKKLGPEMAERLKTLLMEKDPTVIVR